MRRSAHWPSEATRTEPAADRVAKAMMPLPERLCWPHYYCWRLHVAVAVGDDVGVAAAGVAGGGGGVVDCDGAGGVADAAAAEVADVAAIAAGWRADGNCANADLATANDDGCDWDSCGSRKP